MAKKKQEPLPKHRILMRAWPEGVLITDKDGLLTYVNPALEEMFGIPSAVFLGTHFRRYITPASAQDAEVLFLRCARGKVVRDVELEAVHPDGPVFPIEIVATPILRHGRFQGVTTVVRDISRRKRAEEALRESERRFRTMLERSLDVAYRRDMQNNRYDYISPVVRQITGFTPEEVTEFSSEHFFDQIHPDDVARVRREFAQAIRDGSGAIEYRFRCKDGAYRWLADYFVVERDEAGRPLYITGSVRNITDLKRTERALHSSERRFRKLFEADLMGVFVTKLDGTFLDCNDAMVKMLGYQSREELMQHRSSDFYVDAEFRQNAVLTLQRHGVYMGKEGRLRRKDGSIAYLLGAAVLIQDDEIGEPYIQGVAIDITERKRAEEALHASEQRYRKLFAANLAGVYLTKPDGTILDFNDAMMRMLGYDSREEVFRHRSTDFYADPEFRKELIRLLRTDGIVPAREAALLRKDGSLLHTIGHAVLLVNEQTGEPYIQGAAIDITERKRAEESLHELTRTLENKVAQRTAELERRTRQLQKIMLELQEAEDRERQRLGEILHDDLQQELAAARFHVGLMRRDAGNNPALQEKAAQAERMLKDAIGKSRSLSHELSPAVMRHGDLAETLRWLGEEVQARHGLVVHVQADSEVHAESDAIKSLLYRAARELLFNAIKHAGVNEAYVRIRRHEGFICLSVCDHGSGFDPRRLGQTGGFGLLSIRERVELLRGRMRIESAEGKGSRFSIMLPAAEQVTEALPWGAEVAEPGAAGFSGEHPLRVLLADDHEVVRQGLVCLLSEERAVQVVGEATNGREVVELADRLAPDVVVMDVSMPLIDGDAATRQIKTHRPQTRVVALSMHEEPETREQMRQAGAEGYVLKTAPAEELLAAIRGAE
jgi:PAS domain S-box-containing protein